MKTPTLIIIAVVIALAAFAAGRFFSPEKIVTKEVQVVKEVEVTKRDTKITIKELTRPDGTKEVNTVIDDRTRERTRTNTTQESSTVVNNIKPQWKVDAMARVKLTDLTPIYGFQLQRRVLGPLFLGVQGWSDSYVGVSVGLEF